MPIYEYECKKCGHCFEELVLAKEAGHPPCPECRSKEVQQLMSAGTIRSQGIASGSGGFKGPACAPSG